jgi:DNA polymerase V
VKALDNAIDWKGVKLTAPFFIPFFDCVKAGFPSPASDFLDAQIDLTKLLVPRPSSTFLMRVSGDSMVDAGILDGAIIVVDRSIKAKEGAICVCYLDGEFTVKRVQLEAGKWVLHAANPRYPKIVPDDESNFLVWGTVTYALNPTNH